MKRIVTLLLTAFLILSAFSTVAFAAEVTEGDTYVLNRDGNGEELYMFQSPCMVGYDMNNKYGGNGVPIQVFVYTMYNSETGEHFPTYCADINVTAVQGANYRRMNLEDSAFSATASGMIRAILEEGFYVSPINGESEADFAARVAAKTAALAEASGVEGLTTGEAIAATQTALWRIIHGPELTFPKFCRYVFNPTKTKYASLCSYSELRSKNNALINTTIETAYDYLLSLDPIPAEEKTVSASSFIDLNDPVYTQNADGSYDVTVNAKVDVQMAAGDDLTVKAALGSYTASASLADGKQNVSLTLKNVPASVISQEVKLSISGHQTSKGYFLFDAVGGRTESQTMVGYNNSRLPVYAEVVAKEDRVLNIQKTTSVKTGEDSYETKPLSNISFDLFLLATMEEYQTGAVMLPKDPSDVTRPSNLAEYTLTTDENGKVSMNFLHQGLPDGVYLITEHPHPSIVSPIEPMYLFVPSTDEQTGDPIYNITIKPKNEVKGGVHIEKDVISLGNEEASVNAYEPHTWIIGSTVPEDIASGKDYAVTDTLDNRLDYLGNVRVALETKEGQQVLSLTPDTDYKLTVTDVDSESEGKPSDSFEVALTASGMSQIANLTDGSFDNYMLRVYFDAQINANAQMGTEIPNQAELSYTNAVNFEFTAKSDVPVVYTGSFQLLKTDAKDQTNTLAGAVFELYRPATFEEVSTADPRLTNIAGVAEKVIKIPFYVGGQSVTSVTTGADGKVSVSGLAYGKYYLVEASAPEGYIPLQEAFEITVDGSSHLDEKVTVITNKSGAILPSTGGIGTTVYIVGGTLLMCMAAVLLILNKRKTETA